MTTYQLNTQFTFDECGNSNYLSCVRDGFALAVCDSRWNDAEKNILQKTINRFSKRFTSIDQRDDMKDLIGDYKERIGKYLVCFGLNEEKNFVLELKNAKTGDTL